MASDAVIRELAAAVERSPDAVELRLHLVELLLGQGSFTEALTHCTIPWRGPMDRLTLLYKYAPGHMAWGPDYTDLGALAPLLTERQRRLIQRPAVYTHQAVQG